MTPAMSDLLQRNADFAALPTTVASMSILGDGWRLERFIHGLPPLVIAELRRHDAKDGAIGERAYWFLERDGCFIGNTIACLSPLHTARIRDNLLWLLATRAGGAFARLIEELRGLDRWLRLALMRHLFEAALSGPLDLLGFMPNDDARFAVRDEDGAVSLVIDGALEFPVILSDRIAAFEPGWRATHIVACFAPLLMIELRQDDGRRATWVLDSRLHRIDGEDFADQRSIAVLRRSAPPMIRQHWRQLLALEDTAPGYDRLPMLALNQGALHHLFLRVRDLVVPETIDLTLQTIRQPIVLPPAPGRPHGLTLPEAALRKAVLHSPFAAGIQAVQSGRLTWPSPVDGSDAVLEAVFVPQEITIIYQFVDRHGLRFLVATGERDCQVIGLYLPLDHLFIGDTEPPNWWFRGHIPADFWAMLYEHCVCHAESIHGRRRDGPVAIVNVFMTAPLLHLGHYVWNDLTGQAALVRDLGEQAPRSLIIGAPDGQAEFFGPLERLFPSLAGKIDRTLPSKPAFTGLAYHSQMVPVRFTGRWIDRTLRDTVRDAVLSTPAGDAVRRARAAAGPGPVIVAGLRLEDRTFVDPEGFYAALLDHLDAVHPGAILVLDGRNARPGGAPGEVIVSIKDHLASRSPLEAELELVERLRAQVAGRRVTVESAVGLPIETSMAWCYDAALCVSPWGAGLAKYRWLANLPGVILTSRYNLEHRPDLDIYHSPRWMEQPSPVLFPDPEMVTDRTDRHGLAPAREPNGRECFEVDLPHVMTLVDRMLADR